jgi:hypothetical protein
MQQHKQLAVAEYVLSSPFKSTWNFNKRNGQLSSRKIDSLVYTVTRCPAIVGGGRPLLLPLQGRAFLVSWLLLVYLAKLIATKLFVRY